MSTVGVLVNVTRLRERPAMVAKAKQALDALVARADAVLVNEEAATILGVPKLRCSEEALATRADLLLVLGGDGTILRGARLVAGRGTPIVGVNMGGFGFLAELSTEDLFHVMPDLVAGRFHVDERMMLTAQVDHADEPPSLLALNDMVVTKSGVARVLWLRVTVNGEGLASYPADGVIVATPTGSTAYSLSAGGPILHPQVAALVITPICPHTFNSRSLVVGADDVVTIDVITPAVEATLTVDGRVGVSLAEARQVRVQRAPQTTRFVRLGEPSFYSILRTKLAWGGRGEKGEENRD